MRQDTIFSTRLPYAFEELRGINFSMLSETNKTKEDVVIKLEGLKGETKLKSTQDFSKYYDEMKYR